MKQNGWSLIEALIVAAVLMILVGLIAGGKGVASDQNSISFGFNGITEMRCINGFQFVIGEGGQARQVLDEFGKGVRCGKPQ